MEVKEQLLYTKEHEWVSFEEKDIVVIGISEYAQSALGDITFIELPSMGDELEQFGQLASIESVKAASDIFAPMSGNITEINEELNDNPELINKSCYEKGWIAKICIADKEEINNLMTSEEYESFLGTIG